MVCALGSFPPHTFAQLCIGPHLASKRFVMSQITHVELRLKMDTEQPPPSADECEDRSRTLNVDIFLYIFFASCKRLKKDTPFEKVKNIYPILMDKYICILLTFEMSLCKYSNFFCQQIFGTK